MSEYEHNGSYAPKSDAHEEGSGEVRDEKGDSLHEGLRWWRRKTTFPAISDNQYTVDDDAHFKLE